MKRLPESASLALGYGVAAACLLWLLHDVEPGRILRSATHLRWSGVTIAILADVASYAFQGYRWKLLLRPAGELSWMRATQAIYAGLLTNEILPLRPGEAVRAYLVARWLDAPLSTILPSILIERLFDAVWLAIGLGATLLLVRLPRELVRAADLLGVVILIAAAAFMFLVARRRQQTHSELAWAFGISLLVLGSQALAFWLIMRASHIQLGFWAGAAVLLIVHLGTAVPNAPANIGTYQVACVAGLALFGVDRMAATSFSLVVFVLLTMPLIVLGGVALGQSGTTLAAIRRRTSPPS